MYPDIFRVVQVLAYASVSNSDSDSEQVLVSHTLTLIETLLTQNEQLAGDIYKTGNFLLFFHLLLLFTFIFKVCSISCCHTAGAMRNVSNPFVLFYIDCIINLKSLTNLLR